MAHCFTFAAQKWLEDGQAPRCRLLPRIPLTILRNRLVHVAAALRESRAQVCHGALQIDKLTLARL